MATGDIINARFALKTRVNRVPKASQIIAASPSVLVPGNPNRVAFYLQNIGALEFMVSNSTDPAAAARFLSPYGADEWFYFEEDFLSVTEQFILTWDNQGPAKVYWYEIETY